MHHKPFNMGRGLKIESSLGIRRGLGDRERFELFLQARFDVATIGT